MLKYHSHLLAHLVDIVLRISNIGTIKPDFTAGRLLQKIQAAQKCTLSGSARTYDYDLFALVDRVIDAV